MMQVRGDDGMLHQSKLLVAASHAFQHLQVIARPRPPEDAILVVCYPHLALTSRPAFGETIVSCYLMLDDQERSAAV
jgi:hypothetical protein